MLLVQDGSNAGIVFRDDSYGNVARDLDELFGSTRDTDAYNRDLRGRVNRGALGAAERGRSVTLAIGMASTQTNM